MAYLALYRRFRPSGFDGLIGQEHIVRTLVNQINSKRIGHAYLFCGARGTGKTSAAKIFARAINCLSPVNGSPCGKCEVCRALGDGANLDVLEMDAASNNKVENIRDLREKVQYPPVSGKYKVYIIDEVHMLTTEAFNALLKTLEEPPEHAVFILATTEVHKLPSTILSRCMRFDFRLIPTKEIAALVAKIYDEIGKEYEKEAVTAIAAAGAGSIRDALSVADTCVSYREGKLTYNDVLEVLGATDTGKITELIGHILRSETGKTLEVTEELYESGKSVGVLCKDVASRIRELIVVKTCEGARDILDIPEDLYSELKALADVADENRILRCAEIFAEADGDLRYSSTPRIVFETAAIKAATPKADYDIDALAARVSALEREVERLRTVGRAAENGGSGEKETAAEEKRTPVKEETKAYEEPPAPPEFTVPESGDNAAVKREETVRATEEPKPAGISGARLWGTVVRKLRSDGNVLLWVACREMRAELSGGKLTIIATDDSGYGEITKEESLRTISEMVAAFGDFSIEVRKEREEPERDPFEEGTERLKKAFGEDIVRTEK